MQACSKNRTGKLIVYLKYSRETHNLSTSPTTISLITNLHNAQKDAVGIKSAFGAKEITRITFNSRTLILN